MSEKVVGMQQIKDEALLRQMIEDIMDPHLEELHSRLFNHTSDYESDISSELKESLGQLKDEIVQIYYNINHLLGIENPVCR